MLLLYMFHKVNRDISRALNAPSLEGVEDGGEALPGRCPIGGGVPLLNSLFNNFTYSTMRASNSDGAIPGMGPRATVQRTWRPIRRIRTYSRSQERLNGRSPFNVNGRREN